MYTSPSYYVNLAEMLCEPRSRRTRAAEATAQVSQRHFEPAVHAELDTSLLTGQSQQLRACNVPHTVSDILLGSWVSNVKGKLGVKCEVSSVRCQV
jgi:hypothetical protein